MFVKIYRLVSLFSRFNNSSDEFLNAIKLVQKYNLSLIEFYCEGSRKEKDMIKEELEKGKLKTIYLGAMASKRKGLNLSSLNEVLRKRTVEERKRCVLTIRTFMIQLPYIRLVNNT